MRITIDCQGLQTDGSKNRGIGNYSKDFLKGMLHANLGSEITLLVNTRFDFSEILMLSESRSTNTTIKIRYWKPMENIGWSSSDEKIALAEKLYAEILKSTKPDQYLLLSPFDDIVWSVPNDIYSISIFYDAIPAIFPERYLANKSMYDFYYRQVNKLKNFNELLCISTCSGHDASSVLGITTPQISTINFGLQDFFRNNPYRLKRSTKKVERAYVFAVLGEDDRKNKINLLKAWQLFNKSHPSFALKIAYKQSPAEKINNSKLLDKLEILESVEFLDFVTDDELLKLYAEAECSIFPSFYEGLGLPVLESYAAGRPILVSDASSLPELCPDPELRFNPESPEDIARTLIRLISDIDLQEIAISHGYEILNRFESEVQHNQIREIFLRSENFNSPGSLNLDILAPKNRIFLLTPLKPEKSGIADYCDVIMHSLHESSELILVNPTLERDHYYCPDCSFKIPVITPNKFISQDKTHHVCIYNLGNSEFHVWQYDVLGLFPGIVILHDGYLSGLVSVKGGNNLDKSSFIKNSLRISSTLLLANSSVLEDTYGFLFSKKLNREIVESATAIIVHSHSAKVLLDRDFATNNAKKIQVSPLAGIAKEVDRKSADLLNTFVVFGIVAETKMYREILEGWANSEVGRSKKYVLRFVGADLSNGGFTQECERVQRGCLIEYTGVVSDEQFLNELKSATFAIQLRRSFRGETSAALIDVLAHGIPVIVNDQPGIESYPREFLNIIPAAFSSSELSKSIDKLVLDRDAATNRAVDARNFLREYLSPSTYVNLILEVAREDEFYREFSPISQTRYLAQNRAENSLESLREIAGSCVASFPKVFSVRRILVVVNYRWITDEAAFQVIALDLAKRVSESHDVPFYIVVPFDRSGTLISIHNLILGADLQREFELWEQVLVPEESDIIITKLSQNTSKILDDTTYLLIQTQLRNYLEE